MLKKPSFLERLTGSVNVDDFKGDIESDELLEGEQMNVDSPDDSPWPDNGDESKQDGELPIDMYHTGDNVVIRALVAGVNPDDLDVAITRDMVTIKGLREEEQEAPDDDYYHRELYWGGFSRTILLPEEVLIDQAEAKERHGLLIITLPKVDKERSAKLKVKPH